MNESVELRKVHTNLCSYCIYFINDNTMKGALRKIRGDQLLTPKHLPSKGSSKKGRQLWG